VIPEFETVASMPSHAIRAREPRQTPGARALDSSPEVIGRYLEDAAHFPGGHADAVARPATEAEVSALVQSASRVLAIGAQSSVTGGATPDGGLILSTERLRSVQESGQDRIRAGAGVPLDALQTLLIERGRWYAPVPTFTGAFVGGVVSTNAAGAATFKYGPTRPWVDGLVVVLACGHVLDLSRGECRADPRAGFEIACPCGVRRFAPGTYRMPDVPKCSAGYFAAPGMDLIDLFVGAEGTLGVVVEATLRVMPVPGAVALAIVCVPREAEAVAIADTLRRASQRSWLVRDPAGIDIAAIEHLDRRCLELLREDGADRKQDITVPPDTEVALIVQIELPAGTTAASAFEEIGTSASDGPDTAMRRFCRALAAHGVLDRTEMALPGQTKRAQQLLGFREAAPTGVNRRVGDAKRDVDPRIDKTAADMVVPFDRFAEMLHVYRAGYARRGLDYAIWGHISDGNVHPNVIPRSFDDVVAGREAILEFGHEVTRLGGCPLAEHGVGRSTLKQTLLRQFYGESGVEEMRAIKRALDPDWKLAPGVLF
jgi:D-lactate dehydrogenase (cytochrome)